MWASISYLRWLRLAPSSELRRQASKSKDSSVAGGWFTGPKTPGMSTDTERANIELVQRGFEAFAAGDMAALSELFDAKVTWQSPPVGVIAGEFQGRDAIFGMFGQLYQETAGTFRSVPVAMAATGDKVFVETDATGQRQGRTLSGPQVLIFTIAGGHVKEVRLFLCDYAAAEAFWS
jgi:uncharacterized protein